MVWKTQLSSDSRAMLLDKILKINQKKGNKEWQSVIAEKWTRNY